jgi:hypothetical protein
MQTDKLDAVADRGYFNGVEILACDRAGITVTLPKPMTSGAKLETLSITSAGERGRVLDVGLLPADRFTRDRAAHAEEWLVRIRREVQETFFEAKEQQQRPVQESK